MEIQWTRLAVAGCATVAVLASAWPRDADAEPGWRVGLGRTLFNSWATWGEIGYEWPGAWEIAASAGNAGNTRNGHQDGVAAASFSRILRPQWHLLGAANYYRLGVAYVDGSVLVGNGNFRLGIGLEWSAVQLEYFHYSSGGLGKPNTGVDGLVLRFAY